MKYISDKYGNKKSKKFIHGKYEAIKQQMCLKTAESSKFLTDSQHDKGKMNYCIVISKTIAILQNRLCFLSLTPHLYDNTPCCP